MPEFVDEVIVVDNNSTDRTCEVAASLGAKVIREEVRGYGRSYKRGFAARHRRPDRHPGRRPQLSGGRALLPARGVPAPGSRFPECLALSRCATGSAMSFKQQVRQPGALAGHVDAVFPLGARFAIGHVGVPPLHPEGHEAGIRRHGVLRGDQDRGAAQSADSLRRDFDSCIRRGWARPSSIRGATVFRIWCFWSRSASSDEHQRHRAGVERPRLLERLLASLEAQSRPAAELLVVDNGSTDGAPELARERGARVIAMGRNAGFAAAVNRGIREAVRGDWIAVLNSDVELAPGLLGEARRGQRRLVRHRQNSQSAAGAASMAPSTSPAAAARPGACGNGRPDGPRFRQPREIWSPPWTAALFRAEFFARWACWRSASNRIWKMWISDCAAPRKHRGPLRARGRGDPRGSATLGRWHPETVRRMARNQVFLLARHYPRTTYGADVAIVGAAPVGRGGVAAWRGLAWMRGKMQGLRAFLGRARAKCCKRIRKLLEQILRSNEQIHSECKSGSTILEAVFSAHGGGAK